MTRYVSLKSKLFCGMIIPAIILIVVIYLNYVNLNSLGRSAGAILSKNYRSIKAVQQIRTILGEQKDFVLASLIGVKMARNGDYDGEPAISRLLAVCSSNITEEGEKDLVARLGLNYQSYRDMYLSLREAVRQQESWPTASYSALLARQTALDEELDHLIIINEKAMEKAEQETKDMARSAQRYSIALLILAIIFAVAFSYVISGRIAHPLVKLAGSLAQVKQGADIYPQFPVVSRDEIGFLTAEFNRLFERLKAYDRINMDKLTAEKLKVVQAEKAKTRFIADLSHQLKTPMTSLSMGIGLLDEKLRSTVEPRYARLLETALDDCHRLSALINELVDLSRMDAMLKPRPRELLDVRDLVVKCLEPLRTQAEDKGVELLSRFALDLPPMAIDSFRFPWVITNLVGNAIRYTERGGRVVVEVERQGDRYYFTCRDTGVGIDPKYLGRIFDRYTQFAEREKMGAIGLGLAIVKEIIEQHGGDITVQSEKGAGTVFTFWIPIQTEVTDDDRADS